MAIFKISRHNQPSEKKLVRAETIKELIDVAKIKLSLAEDKYKIFMEDFTEIDDDEILKELAESSKQHLILILVPDGIEWNSDITTKDTSRVSKVKHETSLPTQTVHQTSDLDIIYCKLPSNVQKSLRNGKFLEYNEKKELTRVVANYMENDLNDISFGTVKTIAHRIVDMYPNSFKVKIGHLDSQGVAASLAQKFYYRINYVKNNQNESWSSRSYNLEDIEKPTRKPKPQDEYGCVAYLPNLPENETWESQEEKRLNLIKFYESSTIVNDDIIQLMAETRNQGNFKSNSTIIFQN